MIRWTTLLALLPCAGTALAQSSELRGSPIDPSPFRIIEAPTVPGAAPAQPQPSPGIAKTPAAKTPASKTPVTKTPAVQHGGKIRRTRPAH